MYFWVFVFGFFDQVVEELGFGLFLETKNTESTRSNWMNFRDSNNFFCLDIGSSEMLVMICDCL